MQRALNLDESQRVARHHAKYKGGTMFPPERAPLLLTPGIPQSFAFSDLLAEWQQLLFSHWDTVEQVYAG